MYVCSPYRGDVERNVSKAQGYCRFAIGQGVIPVTPHIYFTQFLDDDIPEERKVGMRMGLMMLERCDELWVFGARISEGMKSEIRAAEQLGTPVLYFGDRCEKLQ